MVSSVYEDEKELHDNILKAADAFYKNVEYHANRSGKLDKITFLLDTRREVVTSLHAHYIQYLQRFSGKLTGICEIKVYSWLPFCIMNYIEEHGKKHNINLEIAQKKTIYKMLLVVGMNSVYAYYNIELKFDVGKPWRDELTHICNEFINEYYFLNPPIRGKEEHITRTEETIKIKTTTISKVSFYMILHALNNYHLIQERDRAVAALSKAGIAHEIETEPNISRINIEL